MHASTRTKIAFLGIGLMGSRMSARLLEAGFELSVWNRTAGACDPLIASGAQALQLAEIGDFPVIFICLSDDVAVSEVFDNIQPYLNAQQIIVDFSSLSVDKTKQLAEKSSQQGVIWIDSPVSGGTAGAENGTLVVFAGGDSQTIEYLQPIYSVLAQRVTRMGDTGTGQATKICNQLIVAANSTLIAEAVALADQAGVDTHLLAPALAGGFADSKPFQILTPRMASHVFEPVQWKVKTLTKDLNNAVDLAKQFNLDIPIAHLALTRLEAHQNQGFAESDLATIIQHVEVNK